MKIMSEKNNGTVGEPGHKMRSIQKGASSGRLVNQHERAKKKKAQEEAEQLPNANRIQHQKIIRLRSLQLLPR